MQKFILSAIFIPLILFCGLFFYITLAIYNMDPDTSLHTYWIAFNQYWYRSISFYGFVTFLGFYIYLMFLSKPTFED